jgi:ABC-type transport system substrate-binding protein
MGVFEPQDLERLLHEYRRGRLSRRAFVQALGTGSVLLAGSAVLTACGPPPPPAAPAEEKPKPGAPPAAPAATAAAAPAKPAAAAGGSRDDIVLVFYSDVTSMDPHQNVLREGIKLFYHLYDNLGVRNYETNRVGPWLATSWRTTNDTTWEMELRGDVTFHNGEPFTGSMLGDGRLYMFDKWWMATFPGLAIVVTTLAINLVGDGLRDLLDPQAQY